MQKALAEAGPQLKLFAQLCEELSETATTIALARLLHQPGVAATIIGPGTVE